MRRLVLCLVTVLAVASGGSGSVHAGSPVVLAREAIVVDGWTGADLYSRNPDVMRAPASTVKIMTALVVLRREPMQRVFTVSPYAASFLGSTAGLFAGERMTVWHLLHGLLMPSGNDAAIALAEGTAGDVPRFVGLMNAESRRLQLWHTRYLSPNGFDIPGQVTTARDLARLTRIAMQQQRFARIVRTRYWTGKSADGRSLHRWSNLNKLLWSSPAVDGVKTGTTAAAGACLVLSAHLHGKWVIAVNMGSTDASRFTDGSALLQYGLSADTGPASAR